jgi:ABC-type multidrug transport system ATPase subunit
MSTEPALARVVGRGLVKTFGGTAALRGVDITIEPAQVTLIEGANGSGKSTLIGILGGVIRPSAGVVRYEPIDDVAVARGMIGWVSHETLAYPDLTGKQNVELAARLHGLAPDEAWKKAVDRFELGAFASRPMRTCSRGQRQRLALARALTHEPTLLLLDEPTTGLDKQGVARLIAAIDAEVERGAAVVIVSHEPELFRERAAARVVLERGRVLKQGDREAR